MITFQAKSEYGFEAVIIKMSYFENYRKQFFLSFI